MGEGAGEGVTGRAACERLRKKNFKNLFLKEEKEIGGFNLKLHVFFFLFFFFLFPFRIQSIMNGRTEVYDDGRGWGDFLRGGFFSFFLSGFNQ